MTSAARKIAVVAATAFALGVPAFQAATGWGLSAGEFADQGDQTLRAASYAFSIWGLIYAALVAHAAFHVFAPARDEGVLRDILPAAVAIAGCGVWLIASGANARWASVAIILVSAIFALWSLRRSAAADASLATQALAVWPIALLGGWLLIASVINLLTVATAEGMISSATAPAVAIGAIIAATGLTIAIVRGGINALYGAPVAWGLVAVFVAERHDRPVSAALAAGGAVLVALVCAWAAIQRRKAGQTAGLASRS